MSYYHILVERKTRRIDAIAECMSYLSETVGYRFVTAEEAEAAHNPYDLYSVSWDRVYWHNINVGNKLGHAIPSRKRQVPFGHAIWPDDEAGKSGSGLLPGGEA